MPCKTLTGQGHEPQDLCSHSLTILAIKALDGSLPEWSPPGLGTSVRRVDSLLHVPFRVHSVVVVVTHTY